MLLVPHCYRHLLGLVRAASPSHVSTEGKGITTPYSRHLTRCGEMLLSGRTARCTGSAPQLVECKGQCEQAAAVPVILLLHRKHYGAQWRHMQLLQLLQQCRCTNMESYTAS
ncbi:hypothetical protein E2C01_040956 [Portunus trituberculatus]|uniref:Uncharacterized protein n=1 Tax=Portunus trituberculatus TaxID=210409 RepID=A0A5B7FNZ7_PORTR|nr:hypothetical protein [Portunus trituberculatus]